MNHKDRINMISNKSIKSIGDKNINVTGTVGSIIVDTVVENKPTLNYNLGSKICKKQTLRNTGLVTMIGGFIGLMSNLISFWNQLGNGTLFQSDIKPELQLLLFFVTAIGMGLTLFYFKKFRHQRFAGIFKNTIFSQYFILSDTDSIHKVVVKGSCPKCNGSLSLDYNAELNEHEMVCNKNPKKHRYDFDHTEVFSNYEE